MIETAANEVLTLPPITARELMTPNPVSIRAEATVTDAITLLTDRGINAAPVIGESGRPVGVISRADILIHERERATARLVAATPNTLPVDPIDHTPVHDLMTPILFSVTAETSGRVVVEQMLDLRVHHMFVVDDAGIPVGVISPFDVLRHLV